MAESSRRSYPGDDEPLPFEPTFPGEGITEYRDLRPDPRRASSSTSASRRQSYYDTQRGGSERRSRPVSIASQTKIKSKGKHASYPQPGDYQNLGEHATPMPNRPHDDRSHLEDTRGRRSLHDSQGGPVTNFSRPDGVRRRAASTNQIEQNTSDVTALPPLPARNRFSQQTTAQNTQYAKPSYEGEPAQSSSESPNDPPAFGRRHPDDVTPSQPPAHKLRTELYTVSYLIFFAIFGTLARLGIQWLTFYPGAPVTTPVLWANMIGSMVMGFLAEDQGLFRDHAHQHSTAEKVDGDLETADKAQIAKHKKTIPLYIGLATGFCGSFTSFSSFARDYFLALSNNLPAPINHPNSLAAGVVSPASTIGRNGGYSFEAMLAVILSTLALSIGGLIVGSHTALALDKITPTLPVHIIRKIVDPTVVVLGFGCWLGAVLMAIFPPDRPGGPSSRGSWANETWRGEVIFSLVFAPLGCLLRFYTSLKLNPLVPAFPLGTFAVNMFGTAVEGMLYDIQHVGVGVMGQPGGGIVGCQVLQGLMDGFCGCLTTVSTWVAEINGLKRKHGYFYALASIAGGFCLMVIIMGSVRWSRGFAEPVCNTGYPTKMLG